MKRGEVADCAKRVMRQSDIVVTKDPLSTCANCPLSVMYSGSGAITVRLEYDGKHLSPCDLSAANDPLRGGGKRVVNGNPLKLSL